VPSAPGGLRMRVAEAPRKEADKTRRSTAGEEAPSLKPDVRAGAAKGSQAAAAAAGCSRQRAAGDGRGGGDGLLPEGAHARAASRRRTWTSRGPARSRSIARASTDKTGGFEACDATGAVRAGDAADAAIAEGTTLRTDARTRARVSLADGTWVALDRNTELAIASGKGPRGEAVRGLDRRGRGEPPGAPARSSISGHGHGEGARERSSRSRRGRIAGASRWRADR
jgi:hypothetical protein